MRIKRWRVYWSRNVYPFFAGLGSASVVMLAFFIPSIQDQWDRYQSRKVIEQYETLGDSFYTEEHYKFSEQAYSKAFELSENKRLDIEVKRLTAKVNRIYELPLWADSIPEDFEEIDFQYLLHLQTTKEKKQQRFETLNGYGYFLATQKRYAEAEKTFQEAQQLLPNEELTYVNLGNLYDQEEKETEAEKMYLKALSLDSTDARANYNIGLLYQEQNKFQQAEQCYKKTLQAEPSDKETLKHLKEVRNNSKTIKE